MEELIKKANELGLMIKGTGLYKRYEEMSRKLEADADAKALLDEYGRLSEQLQEKEAQGAPIEVAEKQSMQEMVEKVTANQLIKEYIATQSYFFNLMMHVQKAISEPQGEPIEESKIIKPGQPGKIITDF